MAIFGRPFVKWSWFSLCYGTIVLSVCDVGVLWPNGWMDQDVTWYKGRPRPRRHYVRWGPSTPPRKGARHPLFGPCLLWQNGRAFQQLLSSCSSKPGLARSPSVLFLHLFWKRTFGDKWHWFFYRSDAISVTQPTVSEQWGPIFKTS